MTGHYTVKSQYSEAQSKVYLFIFVCMSTTSGHLEVVSSVSSLSFSEALEWFINRCRTLLYFYHGNNFKDYISELKILFDIVITANLWKDLGIAWRWMPISTPHMNALVERYLSILKTIVKETMGNKVLHLSQMTDMKICIDQYYNFLISHVRFIEKMSPQNISCIVPEIVQFFLIKMAVF